MLPREFVESYHFGTKIRIHGHLSHDFVPEGDGVRWYIYQIEDVPCHKIYVGSTTSPLLRWANHKATANSEKSKSTGLSKHFIDGGCPNDTGRNKNTLRFTLVDYLDTSLSKLQLVGHVAGAKCRCSECEALKRLEDRFILKTGSFYTDGLNAHDQIKSKCRGNF